LIVGPLQQTLPKLSPSEAFGTVFNITSLRVFLLQSQVRQDSRILFARGQDLMTGGEVIGNGLATSAGVVAIMAAKAARRVIVP
jgi:hypothetical protein